MMLPSLDGLVGHTYLIDGPFGRTVQTLVGAGEIMAHDGEVHFHLFFEGSEIEDGEWVDTVWEPRVEYLRSAKLIAVRAAPTITCPPASERR